MLAPVEMMSDAGLRRGYLHRVRFRRLLILEWLRHAPGRVSEEEMSAFTIQVQKPGRLNDIFRRLLAVGAQLNAQHDPSRLPDQILAEVDELTGAERIALVLFDPQGKRRLEKSLLPKPPYPTMSVRDESSADASAFLQEISSLVEQAANSRQGFIRQIDPSGILTEQRSVLVSPLISQGKLVGVVYCDLAGCFGRFDPEDLDLLGVLANQAAVAIENADWSATLEQKVEDRTAELQASNQNLAQRNNELAVINTIQQGLAAELDFQAIVDLVGDKLRQVFASRDLFLIWYDEKANLVHYLYAFEHDVRLAIEPQPPRPDGILFKLQQSRQLIVWNTVEEGDAISPTLPGTDTSKSGVAVPIISNDRIIGSIQLENYDREFAFGESELRLISTVAASLGAALENARLFAETQRLLKETEQRSNELSILNSVGEAMAKTMDVKTVTHIVGDKVLEIFSADAVSIMLLDEKTNLIHTQYEYDKGEGGYVEYIEPFPLGTGLTSLVITTRQSLMVGTIDQQAAKGAYLAPELLEHGTGVITQSWLGVPIITNDRVMGVVGLGDYQANKFDENHLRLLQTLSSNMGVAIENARLFQAEQERVSELQIINSIQQGLAAELDFQAIVDLVGDKLRQVFDTPDLAIGWIEEKNDLIHYLYIYEHGERLFINPQPLSKSGITQQIFRSRKPVVWNTIQEGDALSPVIPGTDASKSGIALPIISSDRILGKIQIENFEKEYAFGDSEQRLLTTIAASLGAALDNARLFDETQRLLKETEQHNAELAVINSIQQGLAAELNFQAIVDLVGDKLREVLHTGEVGIRWYDSQTDLVHYLYEYEHDIRLNIPPTHPASGGPWSKMVETRQPFVINSMIDSIGSGLLTVPGTDQSKSAVYIPLIGSDRVIGSIIVENYERENAFNDSDVRLLQTVANSMGVALENARLFDETQRLLKETEERNAELAVINSVQAALAAELNIQGIYDTVGDKIREIFNHTDLGIRIYDLQTNLEYFPYTYEGGQRINVSPLTLIDVGMSAYVRRTRETLVINENMIEAVKKYGSYILPGTVAEKSAVYVPLVVGDQARGLINLSNMEREQAFSGSDVRLLQTLANSMSVALENARLFQAEKVARRRTDALYHVAHTLVNYENVAELLQTLANRVVEALPTNRVSVSDPGYRIQAGHPLRPGGRRLRPQRKAEF